MGSHFLLQEDPGPGIEPGYPAFQVDSFNTEPPAKPNTLRLNDLAQMAGLVGRKTL